MDTVILKTNDGTEVIGEVVGQSPGSITVRDPLVINYRFMPQQHQPMVSMSRYMPFAIDPVFNFRKEDIRHQAPAKPGLVHYWRYAVSNYVEYIDDSLERQMFEAVPMETETKHSLKEAYNSLLENMDETIPH